MITFRAIAAGDGEKTAEYFLNKQQPSQNPAFDLDTGPPGSPNEDPNNPVDLVAYYTGRGSTAVWRHDLPRNVADALGIDPDKNITKQELSRLYEGKRADTGEKWAGRERELSGYDFAFSPHKSVSLAAEFAASPAERAAIRTAVLRTNDDTLAYIAQELGWARKGKGGRCGADPGDTAWISYAHQEARPTVPIKDGRHGETTTHEAPVPGDPQYHVHNTLWNLVVTEDGRVGSLDTKRLRSRVHEFGAYGQARLANELRKLGIPIVYDDKEQAAVIPAIPQIAIETFSKSRRQILETAKDYAIKQGLKWDDISATEKLSVIAAAAQRFRLPKREESTEREIWRAQAQEIGWSHKTVLEEHFTATLTDEERFEQAYTFAARHLAEEFRTANVIDHDKLRLYAARGLIGTGIADAQDIDQVVDLLEERGITIDDDHAELITAWTQKTGRRKDREQILRVTTTSHLRIEQELTAHIQRAAAQMPAPLEPEAIRDAIARSGLNFSSRHGAKQVAAMHAIGQGGAATLLTGAAGSGKTTLLTPLVAAWKDDQRLSPAGRKIIGLSTAWKQATALEDSGLDSSMALDPFLNSIAKGEVEADQNTILVIDEVSQIGPKSMLEIFKLQQKTGMTIVALGDREQAQSIEGGDTIEIMRRALPQALRPEIDSTVRQSTARARKIANLFRKESAGKALAMKLDDQTARLVQGDYDQVVEAIASLYLDRRDALRTERPDKTITISTPTNEDAAEISRAVRKQLIARGEIGADEISYQAIAPRGVSTPILFDLPIATGDHLRLYKRTWGHINGKAAPIGNNGDIVQVTRHTESHIYLKDRNGKIAEVEWRSLIDRCTGRLMLGFGHALTIDSAQGITSDEHINALPKGSTNITAFKAYVAESRARGTTWTLISKGAMRESERHRRPLGDQKPITDEDLWKRIAEDMSFKPYKGLAIDLAAKAARKQKEQATDEFMRQSHMFHKWRSEGVDIAKMARERILENTLSNEISGRFSEFADAIRQNAEALRKALEALDAYLRSIAKRGPKSDDPTPTPSPKF